MIIDGCLKHSQAQKIINFINFTGKKLKYIYISHSSANFYLGLSPLTQAFPKAKIIAAQQVAHEIGVNSEWDIALWNPAFPDDTPECDAQVQLPEIYKKSEIELGGHKLEICHLPDLPNQKYIWCKSLRAIFGSSLVFAGVHVWVGEAHGPAERQAWIQALDEMIQRKPKIVVPCHATSRQPFDSTVLHFTKHYLQVFEEVLDQCSDSRQVVAAMQAEFPQLQNLRSLEISAQVAKGEIRVA